MCPKLSCYFATSKLFLLLQSPSQHMEAPSCCDEEHPSLIDLIHPFNFCKLCLQNIQHPTTFHCLHTPHPHSGPAVFCLDYFSCLHSRLLLPLTQKSKRVLFGSNSRHSIMVQNLQCLSILVRKKMSKFFAVSTLHHLPSFSIVWLQAKVQVLTYTSYSLAQFLCFPLCLNHSSSRYRNGLVFQQTFLSTLCYSIFKFPVHPPWHIFLGICHFKT